MSATAVTNDEGILLLFNALLLLYISLLCSLFFSCVPLSLSQINSQPEPELWKKSNSILWRALAVLAACVGRLAAWLLRGGGC